MSTAVVVLIIVASNFYALSYPSLDAMTMDLTNPKNRKEALALIYMGINIGFAVGQMLGDLLLELQRGTGHNLYSPYNISS